MVKNTYFIIRFPYNDFLRLESYRKNKYGDSDSRSMLVRKFIEDGIDRAVKSGKLPKIKGKEPVYIKLHIYIKNELLDKLNKYKSDNFDGWNVRNRLVLAFINEGLDLEV